MPKKNHRAPKGCTFLLCCDVQVSEVANENFDEVNPTLSDEPNRLQETEDAQRPWQPPVSSDDSSFTDYAGKRTEPILPSQDTVELDYRYHVSDNQVMIQLGPQHEAKSDSRDEKTDQFTDYEDEKANEHHAISYKDKMERDNVISQRQNKQRKDDATTDIVIHSPMQQEEKNADDIKTVLKKGPSTPSLPRYDGVRVKKVVEQDFKQQKHNAKKQKEHENETAEKSRATNVLPLESVTAENASATSSSTKAETEPPILRSLYPSPPSAPQKKSNINRASKAHILKDSDLSGVFDPIEDNRAGVDISNDPQTISKQPVPPSTKLNISVASQPSLPHHFTYLSKSEKLESPSSSDSGIIQVKRGPTNIDLLGVFLGNSDSSLLATYSGSTESELLKLIDFNKLNDTSEEDLPTDESNHVAADEESSTMAQDTDRTHISTVQILDHPEITQLHPLGAAPVVLGPIASKETPEKSLRDMTVASHLKPVISTAMTSEIPVARRLQFDPLPSPGLIPVTPHTSFANERRRHATGKLQSNFESTSKEFSQKGKEQSSSSQASVRPKVLVEPYRKTSKKGPLHRESIDSSSNDECPAGATKPWKPNSSTLTRSKGSFVPRAEEPSVPTKVSPLKVPTVRHREKQFRKAIRPSNVESDSSSDDNHQYRSHTRPLKQAAPSMIKAKVSDRRFHRPSQPKSTLATTKDHEKTQHGSATRKRHPVMESSDSSSNDNPQHESVPKSLKPGIAALTESNVVERENELHRPSQPRKIISSLRDHEAKMNISKSVRRRHLVTESLDSSYENLPQGPAPESQLSRAEGSVAAPKREIRRQSQPKNTMSTVQDQGEKSKMSKTIRRQQPVTEPSDSSHENLQQVPAINEPKIAFAPEREFHLSSQHKNTLQQYRELEKSMKRRSRNIENSGSLSNNKQGLGRQPMKSDLSIKDKIVSAREQLQGPSRPKNTFSSVRDNERSPHERSSGSQLPYIELVPKENHHQKSETLPPAKNRGSDLSVPAFPSSSSSLQRHTSQAVGRDEQIRDNRASTSSHQQPLPPPDLLAPALFKRRTVHGLPPVQGKLTPSSQLSGDRTVRAQARDGHTKGSQKDQGRLTSRARTRN